MDYFKCVLVGDGELSMEMDGLPVTLELHADNWALKLLVS